MQHTVKSIDPGTDLRFLRLWGLIISCFLFGVVI